MKRSYMHLLLFVFVLFFTSYLAVAEKVLTNDQWEAIQAETENINRRLTENEILLNDMEVRQNSSTETIELLEKNSEMILQNNKKKDSSYEKIIEVQENQINELKRSSIMQRIYDWFMGVSWGAILMTVLYYTNVK